MATDGSFSTYSLEIKPSKQLEIFLKDKLGDDNLPVTLSQSIREHMQNSKRGNRYVSVKFLRDLATYLQDAGTDIHFHQLMRGSDLNFPEVPPTPRNPELEARTVRLRQQLAAKDYEKMTQNVNTALKHKYDNEFSADVRAMKSHMAAGLNLVITVGACFAFGYKGLEYMLPRSHVPAQVIMGLIVGSIGALADLYFLLKHIDATEKGL